MEEAKEKVIEVEAKEGRVTLDMVIAAMVTDEIAKQLGPIDEKLRIETSDLVAKMFESLKVDEVAKAVKDATEDARGKANARALQLVKDKFPLDDLRASLTPLPNEIYEQRLVVARLNETARNLVQQLDGAKNEIKEVENNLAVLISGDPRYTNEKQRTAALSLEKKSDPMYIDAVEKHQRIKEQVDRHSTELAREEATLKKLKSQFEAVKINMESVTQEMAIAAAVVQGGGAVPHECKCGSSHQSTDWATNCRPASETINPPANEKKEVEW